MFELSIIVLLLVFNGVFAMAEIALVSAKKARLQQRAKEGSHGAKMAQALQSQPERVLSTVQVGISHVWLRRFRFGPMEWLWRAMTYRQWPPMRREAGQG